MATRNYFEEITVDGYAFPTDPQADFGFNSQGFSFINKGTTTIEYSFDGETVHGNLVSTDESVERVFDFRTECKVWFRIESGPPSDVRVEAWRSRN
jgi:hypothetical protein